MDIQTGTQCSAFYSLDDALENVSRDLVYDPASKKLCIRSQTSKGGPNIGDDPIKCDLADSESNQALSKLTFSELRKQSDSDSGYCGLSSDSNTENGSQKSICETRSDIFPMTNENVDDLDLPISSHESNGRTAKSKLLFIQNVFTKLTSTVTNTDASEQRQWSSKPSSSQSSLSSIVANASSAQANSIIENIGESAINLGKRPSYLPPKSEEEERRHQAEINEILKQAKKRELKETKLKKRILSKQIRQEEEISGAIRCWTNDILPSWPSSHCTKRAKELWWNGIPSPVRPKVWSLAIGNDLKITDELFRICVERSKERVWTKQFVCRRSSNPYPSSQSCTKQHRRVASQPMAPKQDKNSLCVEKLTKKLSDTSIEEGVECAKMVNESEEDEEDKNESIAYLIKLDVSRTFPQLGLFQENGPLHQSLSDVLASYVVYRPDLGYCQGMSFLAGMLLLNLDSTANVFTAFANLLNNELLLAFYRLNQDQMKSVYQYYERQLQAILPKLAIHLREIGLTTDLFFVDQMYTIFSRSLPLECACRIWDLFLRDGNEFIFRASLGILQMYQEVLLVLDFVDAAQFLSRLPDDMDTEKLFNAIASIKLVPPALWQPLDVPEKGVREVSNTSLVKKLFTF